MKAPKYIAHRGLSMHAPENTVPSFELAGRSGFWGIECDTYCTTDGRWIVHHDRTVDRMTDGSGMVKDFTFKEIRKLNIVGGHCIEAYPGLQIPTLEEVLAVSESYGMHVFIEIEQFHRDTDLERLVQLVGQCGMLAQCSFICFNADDLNKVRMIDGDVQLGYLSAKAPAAADMELVRRLKLSFLNYSYKTATPEEVRKLSETGIDISLWTINDRQEALPYIEAGATYVTTDTILTDNGFQPDKQYFP
ncbi:glycerophosphodiester phosphodiesterase [Paenibacillus sp. H1-7]|uniref:glycerophosphodiester phosphodiesterase n=1 Tax=Paenibacillus sp. H1-7 TaxID=2282849 RepID=UPI001EF8FFC0|nr:glycerophosphodiester phosphodiesterase family protein [Paenibacillus sp. H1-7]ULL16413.1 glycerophosphodiester phosphodiesterase [Paenibacillus sp. H1-7]